MNARDRKLIAQCAARGTEYARLVCLARVEKTKHKAGTEARRFWIYRDKHYSAMCALQANVIINASRGK